MAAPTPFSIATLSSEAHSRILSSIQLTPLVQARNIGVAPSSTILLKLESLQTTGSFKLRGATSKLTSQSASTHLITASSGNHGIGCSSAASTLKRASNLTVVLPENVSKLKLAAIKSYGVQVILHGSECGESERHARTLAAEKGWVYISPYNDIDVIAGQGTIGLEILSQARQVLKAGQSVDNVFISLGGGGLVSGIGSVIKTHSPRTKIWGVSAENSRALAASIRAGKVVDVEHTTTIAEAVAGGIDEGSVTLGLAEAVIDELIDCEESEIRIAMRELAFEEGMVVEGSAALVLAGYRAVEERIRGQVSVLVICGGNVDRETVLEVLNER